MKKILDFFFYLDDSCGICIWNDNYLSDCKVARASRDQDNRTCPCRIVLSCRVTRWILRAQQRERYTAMRVRHPWAFEEDLDIDSTSRTRERPPLAAMRNYHVFSSSWHCFRTLSLVCQRRRNRYQDPWELEDTFRISVYCHPAMTLAIRESKFLDPRTTRPMAITRSRDRERVPLLFPKLSTLHPATKK